MEYIYISKYGDLKITYVKRNVEKYIKFINTFTKITFVFTHQHFLHFRLI